MKTKNEEQEKVLQDKIKIILQYSSTIQDQTKLLKEKEKTVEQYSTLSATESERNKSLSEMFSKMEIEKNQSLSNLQQSKSMIQEKEKLLLELSKQLEEKNKLYLQLELKGSKSQTDSEEIKELKTKLISYSEKEQEKIKERNNLIILSNKILRNLKPWLGVEVTKPNNVQEGSLHSAQTEWHYKLNEKGIAIRQVKTGSPAERSGFLNTDYIISLNGKTLTRTEDFSQIMNRLSPGDPLTIEIQDGTHTHHEIRRKLSLEVGSSQLDLPDIQRLRQISNGRILDDDHKWIQLLSSSNLLRSHSRTNLHENGTMNGTNIINGMNGIPSNLPIRVTADVELSVDPEASPDHRSASRIPQRSTSGTLLQASTPRNSDGSITPQNRKISTSSTPSTPSTRVASPQSRIPKMKDSEERS